MDKTSVIYDNKIDSRTIKKAIKSKKKYYKKFGDDSKTIYHLKKVRNDSLHKQLGIMELEIDSNDEMGNLTFADEDMIIGTVKKGYGHYRVAIAMASCAHALGYHPCLLDLSDLYPATGTKMINQRNHLYTISSKLSYRFKVFTRLFLESIHTKTFKQITCNAIDQKNSEILVPLYNSIPKNIPFIGTHAWASQGAIHAKMTKVINVIPNNYPLAVHLAEGATHTVQTSYAYLGYKQLHGMAKKSLMPMSEGSIVEVGHYIDHEIVANIEEDCQERIRRLHSSKPLRILLTIDGAGVQSRLFLKITKFLKPFIDQNQVCLMINFGNHLHIMESFFKHEDLFHHVLVYKDNYDSFKKLVENLDALGKGIVAIYHHEVFNAIFSTNLLMRKIDLMVTKPSELAFYPVPKLLLPTISEHEPYGAIHGSEIGDSTYECSNMEEIKNMFNLLLSEKEILEHMNQKITELKSHGIYYGGYKIVEMASKK